jgi:hypothetical protein
MLLSLSNLFGQKTELRGSISSGLFSFSGISALSSTSINWDDQSKSGYTNNPYGTKTALCYGLSVDLKRVTKRNILFGIDAGIESLRSMINIDWIDGYTGTAVYQYSATGKTFLNSGFFNFNPYLGYRIIVNSISFDLTGGLEFGYLLSTTEKGNATDSNGTKYTTSKKLYGAFNFDLRPQIQLSAMYKRFGLFTGYSYGMANYMMGVIGDGRWECYSRLLRFGITYRI